ncbi:hypothetical protein QRX60_40535 [Amycolatopsis mongoliensis]|uniref:Uncharacterized protein n=1 Tax=Amycolatopsis mongoliensis TaxID=715475 RepID=A0A9Y2JNV1_9PSEU|nr:hypothetical protein [Amycolatopsis sp. 4-36]WIY00289.1 hypothetical protein QRX60_40535 [Amycolatopsis sp. 4-36]
MTEGFSPDFPLDPAPGPPRTVVPRPRPVLARPVVAGLLGVLVGAFLVGVPWLVLSLLGGPSGQALTAPANLGGLSRAQDAIAKLDAVKGKPQIDRIAKTDQETASRVSAAYAGAGAVVQDYQDDELRRGLQLIAVRAPSPELFAPYEDVQALGVAKPGTELVRVGAVQCLVHNDPVAPGSTPDPDRSFVLNCQRTGPGLTVTVRSMGTDGNRDPQELAGIVEQAWRELAA